MTESLGAWWAAIRPKTLIAGAVPVVVGTAAAVHDNVAHWTAAAAALAGALLIQIGTNLANDYYDAKHGVDDAKRVGRARATSTGTIPGHHVRNASFAAFAAAAVVGLYLIFLAGPIIILVGIASIAMGLLYTAGPKPLGYIGLGDLLVFLFFGVVAVTMTYYVQALAFSPLALALSVPVGALATSILVINNLRDLPTDKASGKRTLAVLIGAGATKAEYALLMTTAYVATLIVAVRDGLQPLLLLPLLSLPVAVIFTRRIMTAREPDTLNRLLESTARLQGVFSILLVAGLTL